MVAVCKSYSMLRRTASSTAIGGKAPTDENWVMEITEARKSVKNGFYNQVLYPRIYTGISQQNSHRQQVRQVFDNPGTTTAINTRIICTYRYRESLMVSKPCKYGRKLERKSNKGFKRSLSPHGKSNDHQEYAASRLDWAYPWRNSQDTAHNWVMQKKNPITMLSTLVQQRFWHILLLTIKANHLTKIGINHWNSCE